MITGRMLVEHGWPEGPLVGMALAVARHRAAEGLSDEDILAELERVWSNPETPVGGAGYPELAEAVRAYHAAQVPPAVRAAPLEAPVWGEDLIDPQAMHQLQNAMRLPVTVAGALMPDAHVGYGIPIGGVVALDGAVAPYMVGVDIACRMMMSIYPEAATDYLDDASKRERLRRVLRRETRFGMGASFGPSERRQHPVLDDPDWNATPLLRELKDKAHAQLGTSGTGNHFVDVGRLQVDAAGSRALGVEPGTYLAVMTHSGSRGVGATIADRYSQVAREHTRLPGELRHLAWLPLASAAGAEYWLSMNLAGRYASACHHTIHQALARSLGLEPVAEIENHHNFAWREVWRGREVIVHRKGATPAHEGVLGIIPGSQGHDSFVVRGLGAEASIHSASHGAGRQMSRKQAIRSIPKAERNAWLARRGVELLGGGMDEAPQAYKDIGEVLALQRDLVEPVAVFRPHLVLMASDGKDEG